MTTPTRAILFDLDGTLLDTAPDFEVALNLLLQQEGRDPISLSQLRDMVANGSAGLVNRAFNIDANHPDFERLRVELVRYYQANMTRTTVAFDGIQECLDAVATRQLKWGIATNKPRHLTHQIVREFGFNADVVVCPEDVEAPKPAPDMLLLAAERLEVSAESIVFVGDHSRDIDSGKAAGCQTIACQFGYIPQGDHASHWGADFWVESAHEIAEIILQLP